MIYAPILIPTLNRIEHLKRCIKSLQSNQWAKFTDLIISIDYPPNEKYKDGYEKIKVYLETPVLGFKNVIIIKQEHNLGAYANYIFLIKYASKFYDRFIFTEDDNEMSMNFIEFMDKGLELFYEDNNVIAICSNGVSVECSDKQTVVKTQNFSAQGYGTWFEKHNQISNQLTRKYWEDIVFSNSKLTRVLKTDISLFFSFKDALFCKGPLYSLPEREIPIIDMTVKIYILLENKYVVCSAAQTSRNWGYDGSGVNCPNTGKKFKFPNLDRNKNFDYKYTHPMYIHHFANNFNVKKLFQVIMVTFKIYIWKLKYILKKKIRNVWLGRKNEF